jgi:hypothetical protein
MGVTVPVFEYGDARSPGGSNGANSVPGRIDRTSIANSRHSGRHLGMDALQLLESVRMHFFLERTLPDNVRIYAAFVGERWEIDVFEDSHVEISRLQKASSYAVIYRSQCQRTGLAVPSKVISTLRMSLPSRARRGPTMPEWFPHAAIPRSDPGASDGT